MINDCPVLREDGGQFTLKKRKVDFQISLPSTDDSLNWKNCKLGQIFMMEQGMPFPSLPPTLIF